MPTTPVRIGDPVYHDGLSLFPLFTQPEEELDYLLADTAISASTIVVEEATESGSVQELTVENTGETRVLFLEGEELVGAKQNRVLCTSVMIPGKSKTKIPVACVEQGRWRYTSRSFASSDKISSSKLRSILSSSYTEPGKSGRARRSDQHEVWKEVKRQQALSGTESNTGAMADTYATCGERIEEFRQNLGYVKGATGVVVALGPRVAALDLFDKASTCERVWERLLSGFALDILLDPPEESQATVPEVEAFLDKYDLGPWESVEPVGEGEEQRTQMKTGEHGAKLSLNGELVHGNMLAAH